MKSRKVFLCVLYLLLYSSFSTADLDPILANQVEKGMGTSVELLQMLEDLAEWASKREDSGTVHRVLEVFDRLEKIASRLSFVGALVGFVFAFIPTENPILAFVRIQFSEVNRKLDSVAIQINTLTEEMEWAAYVSIYSGDEYNIKNAWAKLREFIDSTSAAETDEEKMRLAERFTHFYETTGAESSVYNFHRYLTEDHPASLNKNLLVLVTEKSKGDFKTLVQFSSYYTSLLVMGLQLNLYYYALKGYDGKFKAKEAVTQLANVRERIQAVLIECVENFEVWAEEDARRIGLSSLPNHMHRAHRIKEYLDKKFDWYEWTVIVHDRKDGKERTYGNSIEVIAQDKVVIHLLHRERGFSAHQGIKAEMQREWNSKGELCQHKISQWPVIFQSAAMKHVEYIHEPSDYAQSVDNELVQLTCPRKALATPGGMLYTDYTTFTVYLRSRELVENHPCSDMNCNNGECKQIRDTARGICVCEKMFYGPTCEGSVQDDIDYAAMESKLNGVTLQPLPDLAAIYLDLQEMREYVGVLLGTLRQDVQWTKIFMKYIDVIEKFRYLAKAHQFLKDETLSQDEFVSVVEALFNEGNAFPLALHRFDLMMQGTGFGDTSNILDVLRQSLLTKPADQNRPSTSTAACSESYSERVDYFVRLMFAMEHEAALGWQRYLLIKHESQKPVTAEELQLGPRGARRMTHMRADEHLVKVYGEYVSQQWSRFNRNGCGSLRAELLINSYCEKPHHSTSQQEVPLACQHHYQPFPETELCSNGWWSALPVCYRHPERGSTTCTSENGATVCTASCHAGLTFVDGQSNDTYQCTKQPCPSFAPPACYICSKDGACGHSEVCSNGECVDGCSVFSCGVNAQCSTTNHVQSCSCVSPWVLWAGHDVHSHGCRHKKLRWVPRNQLDPIPQNAVSSWTGHYVCRARGPDGGWRGGRVWIHSVNTCNYEHGRGERRATSFEVLVDPCGGSGLQWLSGGVYENTVEVGQAAGKPWITYLLCSRAINGVPGNLYNTQIGLMCHWGYDGQAGRDGLFYSLVKKPCI